CSITGKYHKIAPKSRGSLAAPVKQNPRIKEIPDVSIFARTHTRRSFVRFYRASRDGGGWCRSARTESDTAGDRRNAQPDRARPLRRVGKAQPKSPRLALPLSRARNANSYARLAVATGQTAMVA